MLDAGRSGDKVHEDEGTAMGRRWIRWMHKRGIKEWVVPGVIAASTLVKFAIGLGSYSGWQFKLEIFGQLSLQNRYRAKYPTDVWGL